MGCEKSKPSYVDEKAGFRPGKVGPVKPDPIKSATVSDAIFTDMQVDVIKSTWPLIAEDLPGNGTSVFLDIFSAEPAVKNLFPFRHLEDDILEKNPLFRAHAGKFMQALDVVCQTLPNLEIDCPVSRRLMILGAQHATIQGFDIFYFSIFAKCLHLTWEKVLGEEYTEDVKEAWTILFHFIMERIRDGYVIFNLDKAKHNKEQ